MITNTTYRVLVEKLGDSNPGEFIGNEGEIFYDPSSPQIYLSDGSSEGGIVIGGGGGGAPSGWTPTTNDTHTTKQVIIGQNTTTFTEDLVVEGNARVTGILSIGTATIVLDPNNNSIAIGTAIILNADNNTIEVGGSLIGDSSGSANYVGVVTAASLVIGEEPVSGTDVTNWNDAYSWGDHSVVGYLTSFSETDPAFVASIAAGIGSTNIDNWNTAYGWGDHGTVGYLTSANVSTQEYSYRGYSAFVNRFWGDDPSINQIVIYKSFGLGHNSSYETKQIFWNSTDDTNSDDFGVGGLKECERICLINIYGKVQEVNEDSDKSPIALSDLQNFVRKFVDKSLYDINGNDAGSVENITQNFYDNIEELKETLPLLYDNFEFNLSDDTNNINDGGDDQYDGGNYINSRANDGTENLEIPYGDGTNTLTGYFGSNSNHKTFYQDSIWGMVIDNSETDSIWYTGNVGADGSGTKQPGVLIGSPENVYFVRYLRNQVYNNYTLSLSDAGRYVYCSGNTVTITIPYYNDAPFAIGTEIKIITQGDTSTIQVDGGSTGLYVNGISRSSFILPARTVASLIKVDDEIWNIEIATPGGETITETKISDWDTAYGWGNHADAGYLTSGAQGIQGIEGYQGTQGISGSSGLQGTEGSQGVQGTEGFQGVQGLSNQGVQGSEGSQGLQGVPGESIQGIPGQSVTIVGSVATSANLNPTYLGNIGDGYIAQDTGNLWVWDGSEWDDVGQVKGPQGDQGVQGLSNQGVQGSEGSQGVQGLSGDQGVQGTEGLQGSTGFGDQGVQGLQGSEGLQGSAGFGDQGTQGLSGDQGVQGTEGLQGSTGFGDQGVQGLSGDQGVQGTEGLQGTIGSGDQGVQGLSGDQGVQGLQGSEGLQGSTGFGDQGVQGTEGFQGLQGSEGLQGSTGFGDQGVQGTQGESGLQGSEGLQGSTGFGDQGVQGTEGFQGLQGSEGLQGTIGFGDQGVQGLSGDQGVQGLSNQGVQGLSNQGTQGISGNIVSITADDIEITDPTKGLILRDIDGHRWRVGIDTSGVLTTTDLGI